MTPEMDDNMSASKMQDLIAVAQRVAEERWGEVKTLAELQPHYWAKSLSCWEDRA